MASEKWLIDANELISKVDKSKYNNPHPQGIVSVNHRNEHDHFLKMIFDAPIVDAVEVVHGQWISEVVRKLDWKSKMRDYYQAASCLFSRVSLSHSALTVSLQF